MKQTQINTSFNDEEDGPMSSVNKQACFKNGVHLRKIQSAYELQIKPQRVAQSNLFPARKSSYIDHLKNQAFVNNIRLRFLGEDGTVHPRCVPKRSQSAPVFSTATLRGLNQRQTVDQHDDGNTERKCRSACHARENLSSSSSKGSQSREPSKSSGCLKTRRSVPVRKYYGKLRNGFQKQEAYPETNGVFFKVVGSGLKMREHDSPGAYLSALRKDYKRPGRGPEANTDSRTVYEDNEAVARERLDYERQTDELLQYYSSKTEHSSTKGTVIDVKLSGARNQTAAPSPVHETPSYCAIPESHSLTTPHATTTRRSEYFLHLNHRRIYGRQYVPAKPFLLISRQSVLHDKKSCFKSQSEVKHNGSLYKKCDCSVCQSDLTLDTSRLTLSPENSSRAIGPSSSRRQYWVNPSGTLNEDDFKTRFVEQELEEADDSTRRLQERDFIIPAEARDLSRETDRCFTHRSEGHNV